MLWSQRRNSGAHGAENLIQISALAVVYNLGPWHQVGRMLPLDYRAHLLLVASYDMQEATYQIIYDPHFRKNCLLYIFFSQFVFPTLPITLLLEILWDGCI